jgi:hypothetical protein
MSNKLTEFFSKQLSSIIHFMLFKTILHYTNLELINKLKYTQKSLLYSFRQFDAFRYSNKHNSSIFNSILTKELETEHTVFVDIHNSEYESILFIQTSKIKHESDIYSTLNIHAIAEYCITYKTVLVCDNANTLYLIRCKINALAKRKSKSKRKYFLQLIYDLIT